MRNPYYRGVVTYQGVHYPGTHQPLIDEATWQRVQTVLNQHRHGERQRIHNHHLKTTVRCGQCGGRPIIHHAKARNGQIYPYFVCSYRQRHRDQCSFKAVLIDEVDAHIADLYHHIHITPEDRRAIEKYLRLELDRLYARQHTHIHTLTAHARALKAQQATLLQAHYADAVPLDLFKTEQARLTRELDQISRELATLTADREHLEHRLEEALALLEHCHRLYTHPDTPPSLKKLLNTVFFTDILINPANNTPSSTPQRPIHPHPRPPFDHLATPTLRHHAELTNPKENRDDSDDTRQTTPTTTTTTTAGTATTTKTPATAGPFKTTAAIMGQTPTTAAPTDNTTEARATKTKTPTAETSLAKKTRTRAPTATTPSTPTARATQKPSRKTSQRAILKLNLAVFRVRRRWWS